MEKMTLQELRNHSGYVNCAWVMLRDSKKRLSDEDPENVDLCVKRKFNGSVEDFSAWATEYLRDGCGVRG